MIIQNIFYQYDFFCWRTINRFKILINRNSLDVKFTIDLMDNGQSSIAPSKADFSEALQILEVDYSCDPLKK